MTEVKHQISREMSGILIRNKFKYKFFLHSPAYIYLDINECGLGIDSCGTGERCENAVGSYVCRRERHCGTGYTLDEDSQRCIGNI